MERWEGLGYDPGPVGESYTRLGPPTRESAAAQAGAHGAPEGREPGSPGPRAAARILQDEDH